MSTERDGNGIEFKYRAVDAQAAPHPPPLPPSGYSYFTEQAIKAGYMAPGIGRIHENMQNPLLVREAIQRELEKEKIREEIIASEIVRRRELEAEVRREMMLERELGLRERGWIGYDRFSLLPEAGMRFEPRDLSFGRVEGLSLEERIAMSLEERFGNGTRHKIGGHKVVPLEERSEEAKIGAGYRMIPFQRTTVEPKIAEATLTSEVSKEKEKERIVFLAKPEPNLSGTKRKSVTPLEEGTSEVPLNGVSKKKLKEEWSCAICKVSATSERGLNEHIQGKKHKAKEAALGAQRKDKNFGIGIRPKTTAKTPMLGAATSNSSSLQGEKSGVQLFQSKQTGKSSLQTIKIKRNAKKNEVPSVEVIQKANISRNEVLEADSQNKLAKKKKKFKFWCEMCRVGAYSESVMKAHQTGKKHAMQLGEAMKNKTVPTPQMDGTETNNANEPTKNMADDASPGVLEGAGGETKAENH